MHGYERHTTFLSRRESQQHHHSNLLEYLPGHREISGRSARPTGVEPSVAELAIYPKGGTQLHAACSEDC
jgi:hypothetical protein